MSLKNNDFFLHKDYKAQCFMMRQINALILIAGIIIFYNFKFLIKKVYRVYRSYILEWNSDSKAITSAKKPHKILLLSHFKFNLKQMWITKKYFLWNTFSTTDSTLYHYLWPQNDCKGELTSWQSQ